MYSSVVNVSGDTSISSRDKTVFDISGNIYAVYTYNTQVYCRKSSDNGATWVDLGFPLISGYLQQTSSITIDSLDNLHVVWYGYDASNPSFYQIKYSKFNGTTWSSWINIQTITGYHQNNPSIAIDSLNNLHVVWHGTDSSNPSYPQIKYGKFNGTTWSSWINIQTISGYGQQYPSIAIDLLNNLHVVWFGNDSSNTFYQIKYSKFDGTSWSNWVNYTTGTTDHQVYPSACRTYKNFTEPVIIWQDAQTSTIQFRGKFEAAIGYVITLTNPVTLITSQKVPIADFKAKQDETQLTLKAIESDKFLFSLASVDTIVDITIEGVDTILNDIAYNIN